MSHEIIRNAAGKPIALLLDSAREKGGPKCCPHSAGDHAVAWGRPCAYRGCPCRGLNWNPSYSVLLEPCSACGHPAGWHEGEYGWRRSCLVEVGVGRRTCECRAFRPEVPK